MTIYRAFDLSPIKIEQLRSYFEFNGFDFALTTDIDWCGHVPDFGRHTFINTSNNIDVNEIFNSLEIKLFKLNENKFLTPAVYVEPLSEAKSRLIEQVDQLAGQTRLKYITNAPGQDATYLAKLEDARAYVTAGYPADSAPYPWIHAESAAVGATPQVTADFILATAAAWSQVGAQIEGARQAAKRGIGLAETVAEAETIYVGFAEAMSAL